MAPGAHMPVLPVWSSGLLGQLVEAQVLGCRLQRVVQAQLSWRRLCLLREDLQSVKGQAKVPAGLESPAGLWDLQTLALCPSLSEVMPQVDLRALVRLHPVLLLKLWGEGCTQASWSSGSTLVQRYDHIQ